jgi:hypothetical protein
MATPAVEYITYKCKIHNKIIYFFKSDSHITGKYHCWDCQREENIKTNKEKDHGNV